MSFSTSASMNFIEPRWPGYHHRLGNDAAGRGEDRAGRVLRLLDDLRIGRPQQRDLNLLGQRRQRIRQNFETIGSRARRAVICSWPSSAPGREQIADPVAAQRPARRQQRRRIRCFDDGRSLQAVIGAQQRALVAHAVERAAIGEEYFTEPLRACFALPSPVAISRYSGRLTLPVKATQRLTISTAPAASRRP